MAKKDNVRYWLKTADRDWKVANHFSHNLVYLSEKAGLKVNDKNLELLEEISDFNLEARYPDDKFSFYKKSTMDFTENKLKQIARLKK